MNRAQRVIMAVGNGLAVALAAISHKWSMEYVITGSDVEVHTDYVRGLGPSIAVLAVTWLLVRLLRDRPDAEGDQA